MSRFTVDARYAIRNISWKAPCRTATTASITISTALNNGDTLDGVSLVTGDRVLVKNQATGSQNGIYVVGASPARADDFAAQGDVLGMVVIVTEGTANADTAWMCTTNAPITVGTTTLAFSAFGTGGGGGGSTITVEQTGGSPSDPGIDTVQVGDYSVTGTTAILWPEISGVGVADQLTFSASNTTVWSADAEAYMRVYDGAGIFFQAHSTAGDFGSAAYTFNVGEDDLSLYIGEKDSGTIQSYSDQDVELTDQPFSGNEWRTVSGTDITPLANLHYLKHGTVDPSAGGGVASAIGSLYGRNNSGAGELWLKTGASDTAWTRVTVP